MEVNPNSLGYRWHCLKRRFTSDIIFKSGHRDKRTVRQIIDGLLGRDCPSRLTYPVGKFLPVLFCERRSGHHGKHQAGKIAWGYGDNWLDLR